MRVEVLMENLKKRGFAVSRFADKDLASDYLCGKISGETVGFGGSMTLQEMGLYEKLGQNNKVFWHWKNPADKEHYAEFSTYITSVNGVSETGELVNIDGAGNRVAATLFGPKKLYFVIGTNKLTPDLASAIERARNITAPPNAKRLDKKTPCAVTGKCADCQSPDRICRAMVITMMPMLGCQHTEVVIIDEHLGY